MDNPYYLKDTDGGYYNKYPEFQVWEDGFKAGQKQQHSGEPPVLSDEEMLPVIWSMGVNLEKEGKPVKQINRFRAIAQAQRDADVRFYND